MSGIVNQTGAASGIIGTTSAPAIGTGTDGYLLTATGAGVNPAWETAPAGGITDSSQWRINSAFTGTENPVTTNWEECTETGRAVLGSSVTQSSGIFTFPSTGHWMIMAHGYHQVDNVTSAYNSFRINFSINAGSGDDYNVAANKYQQLVSDGNAHGSSSCTFIFDVTNLTTHKISFGIQNESASVSNSGNASSVYSGATFIKLAET